VFVEQFGGKVFDEPIADEIRKEFLKIKVTGIQNALGDEKFRCLQAGFDPDALEVTEGCDQMLAAVAELQALLIQRPKITARELMTEFHNTFVLPKGMEALRDLRSRHDEELASLRQRFPRLVPTFEQYISAPGRPTDQTEEQNKDDMWNMFGPPAEQECLRKLSAANVNDFAKDKANINLPLQVKASVAHKRYETFVKKQQG
jgi:hypothetical protein